MDGSVTRTPKLADAFPVIVADWWDQEANEVDPKSISAGSDYKANWRCSMGHRFQRSVRKFLISPYCPMCGSAAASSKLVRDLWHPTANAPLTPWDLGPMSDRRVWWWCPHGHEWTAIIKNITRSAGCPFCNGRAVSATNNLAVLYPEIAAEWDNAKNDTSPQGFRPKSDHKAWWHCAKGHSWQAQIKARVVGKGCPYCSGRCVTDEGSLLAKFPHVAAEWHSGKNGPLKPADVAAGSKRIAWWQCKNGHEWTAQIVNRTTGRTGCPYCKNKLVSSSNSLIALYSDIAAQWHPTRNGLLGADDVVAGSNASVWWQCSRGHEWKAVVASRTARDSACPRCAGSTSKAEMRIFSELYAIFSDARWREKVADAECDVFLPSFGVGIEYDGFLWHSTLEKAATDRLKGERLAEAGVKLLRVREAPLEPLSSADIMVPKGITHAALMTKLAISLAQLLPAEACAAIATSSDMWAAGQFTNDLLYRRMLSWFPGPVPEKSLAIEHPDLAKEWHPSRNQPLTPSLFSSRTNTMVWWRCEAGHEWKARIYHRTQRVGCPYCSGRIATMDRNLARSNPELAAELHPTLNGDHQAANLTPQSNRRVWWRCSDGHEWQAKVNNRVHRRKCPFCNKKRPTPEYNLAVLHPDIALEWHPMLNGVLAPSAVLPRSNRLVWWRCAQGHEWQDKVNARSARRVSCPRCRSTRAGLPVG